jgi:predicted nucleic acid-binding protein
MKELVFLDTNIFVYSLDRSVPAKTQKATELIRRALTERKGVVSFQVVQEFFNVALRKMTPPMSAVEAERYLQTVFVPMLSVHSSQGLYVEALGLYSRHQLAWYDSLIIAAALQAGCELLMSEDLQHGRRFGTMRVENPFL